MKLEKQVINLSTDMEPTRPDEKPRIIKHDGIIDRIACYDGKVGPFRIWKKQKVSSLSSQTKKKDYVILNSE